MTEEVVEEVSYSDEYVKTIEESLNWHAAILAVLLEEAGGAVEVKKDDLVGIDLNTAQATISYDEARQVYIIERVAEDES